MATKPVFDDIPAWPGENPASAPARIGHNKPPLEEIIPEEFRAELLRERPDFLMKLDQLVEAAERAKAEDEETLGKCGDLVNAYRALLNHINATHKAVKEPHLLAGRMVDAEKNALTQRVQAAKEKVESVGNAFVAKRDAERRAEEARRQAEERAAAEKAAAAERERERAEREAIEAAAKAETDAEREAAEERAREAAAKAEEAQREAALAAAAPVDDRLVRSDAGATVGAKIDWQSQVTDYELAFMAVSDNANVRAAIDKAIASLVRAGKREIDGVRIWPVAKGNFR